MSPSRPSSFPLTTPGPLRLYSMSELLRLPPPSWLVDDTMPTGALVGLYGQPGHYKSFVAIDMAMSVATGHPWHGQTVESGYVIYVAAEGGTGIGQRAEAWLQHHRIRPTEADIAWLTESIPVAVDSENMTLLFDRINHEVQRVPKLIVIDTLARCFDGDENQQEDMGRFIGGVDMLRREYGATVIVVHHTRLGADRERGSTAFRGAADTMMMCVKVQDAELALSCDKQKDAEEFKTRPMQLQTVLLPEHPLAPGLLRKSVVIVEPAVERDALILQWLAEDTTLSFADLKAKVQGPGSPMSPAALKRRLVSLLKSGKILKENGVYRLNQAHSRQG